ncbi:hypothetical protein HHI36_013126 [Cryptolaemus montrouzieri]|uniref:Uncharacterized protein n=1 Tax=Cryptolaemus montrouzieri TaxID=559131 RepID=A0ABD2NGX8_9CUCU
MKSTHVRSNSLGDFSFGENGERQCQFVKISEETEAGGLKLSPTGGTKNEQENKYLRQMLGDIKASLLVEQKIDLPVCEVGSERKYENLEQDIADLRTTLEEEIKKSKELSERLDNMMKRKREIENEERKKIEENWTNDKIINRCSNDWPESHFKITEMQRGNLMD